MKIYKYRAFEKFAKKHKISDSELLEAVKRADNGLIDADLGGGVIKQRIARQGQGRRGGYRSIILFKRGDKAFFAHGFAKSEQENISVQETIFFKALAAESQSLNDGQIESLKQKKQLTEIES